jgi:hypothetical protein
MSGMFHACVMFSGLLWLLNSNLLAFAAGSLNLLAGGLAEGMNAESSAHAYLTVPEYLYKHWFAWKKPLHGEKSEVDNPAIGNILD